MCAYGSTCIAKSKAVMTHRLKRLPRSGGQSHIRRERHYFVKIAKEFMIKERKEWIAGVG